jgi:hypothetical protein
MKNFLLQMFSESGTVSFARVISALIVSFVLGWDTSYVHHQIAWKLTPVLPEASVLLGQVTFMTVFYGVNKAAGAYAGPAKSDPAPPTPTA